MRSSLLVTSDSNLKLGKNLYPESDVLIVKRPPSKTDLSDHGEYNTVIAIGGGSVIDTAKLIAGKRRCFAIPTTASGAAMTSWAVVWSKDKKISVKTDIPILIHKYREMDIKLPKKVEESTYYDCLCHIIDSRHSRKANPYSFEMCEYATNALRKYRISKNVIDLIDAGNYAGSAIEVTGTNFYHALSYVLTLDYGLEHGLALKEALMMRPKYDWSAIIKKAQKYEKFFEVGV